ncbi:TonB-dependent siderophore receptor [Thalassolituus sp. ST750PaO-4]|uniref:TonB-dependent siderophore receptor n=1 Tax=Thalassolituus sp. ST750PaO-4 TaxID=2742965 RepID=UPI001CE28E07|nr:TonB-dependent siderophore receptor [Thalassolituus sp. ST750PaO-4]MCA6059911.1 TonB-dependent siderophore receptor [Thalassolituus sp. ST750PaO-4]
MKTQRLNRLALSIALLNVASVALAETTAGQETGAQIADADNAPEQSEVRLDKTVVRAELTNFGATKSSVPIVETARSVSVETSEQFEEKGALNLSQATSYMAGVTAETYGFATRGDAIHARGLSLPRYRDSIQELFGSYNTTRAEVYTLEQVEVLKGPVSVLYGQGTPGGIVNYVSKTPKADAATEIVAELGNNNRKQLAVDSTGKLGSEQWLYRMVALKRDSDTQVDYVEDNTLVLMPSVSYVPSATSRYTLIAMHQNTDSDTGAQFVPVEGTLKPLKDGTYLDQDVYTGEPGWNKYDTRSNQLTALVEQQLTTNLALEATALWREGSADYNQAWPVFTGAGNSRYLNDVLGTNAFTDTTVARTFYKADNEFQLYALDVRLLADFDTGALRHQVLVGAQKQSVTTDNDTARSADGGASSGNFDYVLDLKNPKYTGAPDDSMFTYTDNPEQKIDSIGLYVSDQISYDNWRFTAGLRYDEVDNDTGSAKQSDDALSASAGVLYAFDNGLAPYISYSESFETVVGIDANGKQLEPREATQYEAGLKFEPNGFPGLFTLSYFDIEITNLPNPNGVPGTSSQQQGVAKIDGVELEGKANVGDFYIQGALSTLNTEDQNGYQYAAEPDSNASLWVTWKPAGKFRMGSGVRYVGESVSETATVKYVTPDYTLVDMMLGYEATEQLDLALNVRNLGDEEYLTSCLARGDCFPGVRRTVNARVTYNF